MTVCAVAFAAAACQSGEQESSTVLQEDTSNNLNELKDELTHSGPDDAPDRSGGSRTDAGSSSTLSLDPIAPPPITARFMCRGDRVTAVIGEMAPQELTCGQVHEIRNVNLGGTGARIKVDSATDAYWYVEFRAGR